MLYLHYESAAKIYTADLYPLRIKLKMLDVLLSTHKIRSILYMVHSILRLGITTVLLYVQ
jgi:hypothetical protein